MTRQEFIEMEANKYEFNHGRAEALRIAARTLDEALSKANSLDTVIVQELGFCPHCFSGEWLIEDHEGILNCLNCNYEIIPIKNEE